MKKHQARSLMVDVLLSPKLQVPTHQPRDNDRGRCSLSSSATSLHELRFMRVKTRTFSPFSSRDTARI